MLILKISKYISVLLISLVATTAYAQTQQNDIAKEAKAVTDTIAANQKNKKTPFISGAAISIDLCGLAMKALDSRFANMEASARLNFKEKYFPIFELGLGDCTREG